MGQGLGRRGVDVGAEANRLAQMGEIHGESRVVSEYQTQCA